MVEYGHMGKISDYLQHLGGNMYRRLSEYNADRSVSQQQTVQVVNIVPVAHNRMRNITINTINIHQSYAIFVGKFGRL